MRLAAVLLVLAASIATAAAATPADVSAFAAAVSAELGAADESAEAAAFAWATDITPAHAAAAAAAADAAQDARARVLARIAAENMLDVPGVPQADVRRLALVRDRVTIPPPAPSASGPSVQAGFADLEAFYATKTACVGDACIDLGAAEHVLARPPGDWDAKADVWRAWHNGFGARKQAYADLVAQSNADAAALGFADTGAMWRAGYDMPQADFAASLDRLWADVRPLYSALHCYVRRSLRTGPYADNANDPAWAGGALPAHILGNMWAQDWSAVYDATLPFPSAPSTDVTAGLAALGWDVATMVRNAADFFSRLGLGSLSPAFYDDSMLERPTDGRDVVCHASAWDLGGGDVRLKACLAPNAEDWSTVHHELGHIFYYLNYAHLDGLFRAGANDGFHEAIGDTIVLSLTPAYLERAGILHPPPPPPPGLPSSAPAINALYKVALERIAFLPFGLLVDTFRWRVFAGDVGPADYNAEWWALRRQYQGVAPPSLRDDSEFDALAKYHVAAQVPYARYFLAFVLQFEFHSALCATAGHTGPLHECSIDGSAAAGAALKDLLAAGASRPWQDTFEALTGSRTMSAQPLLDYFAPLQAFLDEANALAGEPCGWDEAPPPPPPPHAPARGAPRGGLGTTLFAAAVVLLFLAGVGAAVLAGLWWMGRQKRYRQLERHTATALGDFLPTFDGESGSAGWSDDDDALFAALPSNGDRVFGSSSSVTSDSVDDAL